MSKSLLIGLLVVAVVVVGGILIVNMNNANNTVYTATSTPSGTPAKNAVPTPTSAPMPTPAPTTVTTVTTVTTTQQAGVPVVSTDSTVVPSDSTAVLTGKVTPNGAQASYWYEYGRTSTLGTRTAAQAIGSGFAAISAPAFITGLHASTTYFYRLVAQNSLGTTAGATNNFTTNNNPPLHGNAPTSQTHAATSVSRTSANLNGEANPNGSQTSYWFEYGTTAELGSVTTFQSAGAGTALVAASVSVPNLQPLTKYFFRMNAQNQFGTANGAIVSFTTLGPAAPSAPTVTTSDASNIATSSATLHGRVNPNGDPTSYWFEYSLDSQMGTILGSTPPTQLAGSGTASVAVSAKASGLQSNTRYYYRLDATNSSGTVHGSIVAFQTRP
jgi:phosphodiesterase/alkaline phosphatase D-like protein